MDDVTFAARRATSGSPSRGRHRHAVPHARAVAAARGHPALPERPARRGVRHRVADADVRPHAAGRRQLRPRAGRLRRRPAGRRRRRPATRPRDPRGRSPTLLDTFLERRASRRRGLVAVGAALPRDDRPRREDADHLRVDPHGRQVGHLGAHPRPDRRRQGSRGPDDPRADAPRHRSSSRPSTARRCPTRCSSRRSSATRRARSPARTTASPDGSSWPTTARCSSTRSATCRWSPRPSCCACSRSGASSGSAATARSRSTSA